MRKAILLDLDQTIFDFHRSERESLEKVLISYGIEPSDEMIAEYSRINDSQWKLLEKGIITREEVLLKRFELFFDSIGRSGIDPERTWKSYEHNLSQSWHFLCGAEEILRELYAEYELYIVSNGTASVQDGRIKASGISKYFKNIFISQRIGYNKPDKRFFDACFDMMNGIKREEALIVGDSLSSDILGGKNAGIATVWFNPSHSDPGKIIPDYQITSLDMLPIVAEMFFEGEK